jgi:primosomal protein N'
MTGRTASRKSQSSNADSLPTKATQSATVARPDRAASPTAQSRGIRPSVTDDGTVQGVADVLCDETGRLGSLSYIVPPELTVRVGDAVHVPFGQRELHGVVLGSGDPTKATRELIRVYGRRAAPAEIALARRLAERNFGTLEQIAVRLAPRSGRGHDPITAGPVVLADAPPVNGPPIAYPEIPAEITRRLLVRAPLVDPAALAAQEAERISRTGGQVLVLCPTVELVDEVTARFTSGAVRVDTKARRGAWRGFCEGNVAIAVGTRSAALYTAASLAGIVVVEEDHPGHQEATQPYTHARDVAAVRATILGTALVLITANPTTSGIGADVKVFAVGRHTDWPTVRVLDRDEFAPDERLLPPPLRAALTRAAAADAHPVLVCNPWKATRRCGRCGTLRPCPTCTSSLCTHRDPEFCPTCGHDEARIVGWDVERLASRVGAGVEIITANRVVEASHRAARTPRLVAVLDIDATLNAPGFTPEAAGAQLIVAAARIAGPGGRLTVCTDQPDHDLIRDLCRRRDQLAVARRAWQGAKQHHLPPFGRLVTIRSGQGRPPAVHQWPGMVYGPRQVGEEWEVLVKLDRADLDQLRPHLARLRRGGKVRVSVL